jgi:hypothetical protein
VPMLSNRHLGLFPRTRHLLKQKCRC